MLMFVFMLVFSMYLGWRGASPWWTAGALVCWQIGAILVSAIGRSDRTGEPILHILGNAQWGPFLGLSAFYLALFCGLQWMIRHMWNQERARPDQALPPPSSETTIER